LRAVFAILPSREEKRERIKKMFDLYYAIALIAFLAYIIRVLDNRCHREDHRFFSWN